MKKGLFIIGGKVLLIMFILPTELVGLVVIYNLIMVEQHRANLLATHKYLKSTGILDAYASVISTLINEGWP